MSEIKRVATPMANTMMVLERGEDILRSPSSLTRRILKKTTSGGLVSLSAEPGNVKFEVETQVPESGGPRCSSAGRIERKLQLFKKKEDIEKRRNSTDEIFYKSHPDNPLVEKLNAMKINAATTPATKLLQDEKPPKPESESSESESESDESESDGEETETSSPNKGKVIASLEIKAEFIQCVMNGEYIKAQQICQKILLLEPDNATCNEFHSVIVMKIEQDNMEDSDDSDEDEEDNDDEDEDDNSNTSSSSSEESETDSEDEEFTVAPGLNLLMGGLPIKPQSK